MNTVHRPLTEKEAEVFSLMAVGLTNEQIADQIETGTDNVKKHIASIFGKVGALNRAQAISLGFRADLLTKENIDDLAKRLGYNVPPVEQSTPE